MAEAEDSGKFLPPAVKPKHYEILFTPDLSKNKVYGEISITIDIKKPVKTIKLHQKNLEITHDSSITQGESSTQVTGTVDDNKEETVMFRFPEELSSGEYVLHIKWTVELTKETVGIYRTTYHDLKGKKHKTLATNFEPCNARRCFPCFDEPKSKATFDITVVAEARFQVLSTMPPYNTDNILDKVYPPMRMWKFQTTPLMSTYSVGLFMGEWDRVERKSKNGAAIRTWNRLLHGASGESANEWAAKLVDFYDHYFDLPYPLPKLDMVPVRDLAGSSAENWGVISFQPQYLSFDSHSSKSLVHAAKFAIAKEIAHMWYGGLVAPRSWDGVWVKEGFASYIAQHACHSLEPHQGWREHFLLDVTFAGKRADSLVAAQPLEASVANSGESSEQFNAVSDGKGANLFQLVEKYIGANNLREGVKKHLNHSKFKNTASLDMWQALMKVSEGSNVPVPLRDVMKDWVKQEGYPLITVEKKDNKLKLTQSRFALSRGSLKGEKKWVVPLLVTSSQVSDKSVVMKEATLELDIGPKETWFLVNAGQSSFVRVHYQTAELRKDLFAHFASLAAVDKLGLLDDHIELYKNGKLSLSELFDLFNIVAKAESAGPAVWQLIASFFGWAFSLWGEEAGVKEKLSAVAIGLLLPVLKKWGYLHKEGESSEIGLVRGRLIRTLVQFGEKETLAFAQEQFDKAPLKVSSDVMFAVFASVAAKGPRTSAEALLEIAKDSNNKESVISSAVSALAYSPVAADVTAALQLCLIREAPERPPISGIKVVGDPIIHDPTKLPSIVKGDFVKRIVLNTRHSNNQARQAALSFVLANWDAVIAQGGGTQASASFILNSFSGCSDEASGRKIKDFANKLNVEAKTYVSKTVAHVTEAIAVNTSVKNAGTNELRAMK